MTIPRMDAIAKRWEKVPPLSVTVALVAASLGVPLGKKEKPENDLQGLIDMMGSAGLNSEKPAWLTT